MIKIYTKTLEKRELGKAISILPKGVHGVEFQQQEQDYGRMLAIALRGYILSEDVDSWDVELPYTFPSGWFQHLKKSLGFSYKTKTHYRTAKFEQRAFYPDARFNDVLGTPTINVMSSQKYEDSV